jgi:hypothetical protein
MGGKPRCNLFAARGRADVTPNPAALVKKTDGPPETGGRMGRTFQPRKALLGDESNDGVQKYVTKGRIFRGFRLCDGCEL